MGEYLLRLPGPTGQKGHWQPISKGEGGPEPGGSLFMMLDDGTWVRHVAPYTAGAKPFFVKRPQIGVERVLWFSTALGYPATMWGPMTTDFPWIAYGSDGLHYVWTGGTHAQEAANVVPLHYDDQGGNQTGQSYAADATGWQLETSESAAGLIDYWSWPDQPEGWYWHEIYPMSQTVAVIDVSAAVDNLVAGQFGGNWQMAREDGTGPVPVPVDKLPDWTHVTAYFSVNHYLEYRYITAPDFAQQLVNDTHRLYRVPFSDLPGSWVDADPATHAEGTRWFQVPFLGQALDLWGDGGVYAGSSGPVYGEKIGEFSVAGMPAAGILGDPLTTTYYGSDVFDDGVGMVRMTRGINWSGVPAQAVLKRTYTRDEILADQGRLAFALATTHQAQGATVSADVLSQPVPGGFLTNPAGYNHTTRVNAYAYVHFPAF